MKNRLVFFVYVDKEYKDSVIYDIHISNLRRYSNLFDCATLYFSLKEINEDNLSITRELTKKIIDAGFINGLEVKVKKNTPMREVECFKEEVISRIENNVEELVFFTHSKGLSNRLNRSLFRWICGMYYFGLNFNDEIRERFINRALPDTMNLGSVFYGFPLLNSNIRNYLRNKVFYAGTIYWINCPKAAQYNRCFNIDTKKEYTYGTRCFAEEFPGDYFLGLMSQCRATIPISETYSLYDDFDKQLELIYELYDSSNDRVNFDKYCDDIINETGVEL